jgi:acyl carrier protein
VNQVSDHDVLAVVARIAGPGRSPAGASAATPLTEEGFWLSSLELVELVVACEEAFGVMLDPERDLLPGSLRSVGSLAAVIRAWRPAGSPHP